MKNILALVLASLAAIAPAQVVDKNLESSTPTGSLWSDKALNPFVDRTARRVGDLVTIVISETSVARMAADTSLTKTDANSVTPPGLGQLFNRIFKPLSTGSSGSSTGAGSTNSTGNVSFRLTAVVREVLPNGVLVLEGARTVTVNKDVQTFKLTGAVRRDDILPNNTVLSESIADAEIKVEGKGGIQDRQRRGLLTRLLDWLF